MMSLGGNKNLKTYFVEYNLLQELPENKYKTIAAEYYRQKLRSQAFNEDFFEEKPEHLEGNTIIIEKLRTPEEIMQNNPPF